MKTVLLKVALLSIAFVLAVTGRHTPALSNVLAQVDDAPLLVDALQPTTFATVEVTIDPKGKPLGAFQFELTSPDASLVIIGVEAGDHPAFDHGRPPYFDPVAVQGDSDRLILAEYALPQLEADALPTQAIVVAKVGVMYEGNEVPEIKLTVTAAGDADARPIDAQATYTLMIPERPE